MSALKLFFSLILLLPSHDSLVVRDYCICQLFRALLTLIAKQLSVYIVYYRNTGTAVLPVSRISHASLIVTSGRLYCLYYRSYSQRVVIVIIYYLHGYYIPWFVNWWFLQWTCLLGYVLETVAIGRWVTKTSAKLVVLIHLYCPAVFIHINQMLK